MTLAEAALGLTLGAAGAALGAETAALAARGTRAILAHDELITHARNTLEWRLGARCAAARPCSAPISCTITTESAGLPAGVVRVVARAERAVDGARAQTAHQRANGRPTEDLTSVEFRALARTGPCP